ncbi:MAG: hypothetical protein RL215_44 [Planctomycetota bacterium]
MEVDKFHKVGVPVAKLQKQRVAWGCRGRFGADRVLLCAGLLEESDSGAAFGERNKERCQVGRRGGRLERDALSVTCIWRRMFL